MRCIFRVLFTAEEAIIGMDLTRPVDLMELRGKLQTISKVSNLGKHLPILIGWLHTLGNWQSLI